MGKLDEIRARDAAEPSIIGIGVLLAQAEIDRHWLLEQVDRLAEAADASFGCYATKGSGCALCSALAELDE